MSGQKDGTSVQRKKFKNRSSEAIKKLPEEEGRKKIDDPPRCQARSREHISFEPLGSGSGKQAMEKRRDRGLCRCLWTVARV